MKRFFPSLVKAPPRGRRRCLAGLLCLWLLLFSGCAQAPADADLKIGVSVYKGDDTFISSMMDHFRQTAADYEAKTGERINLTFADANESQSTQNSQIERFLSLGYDVLCVNLVDRTDAGSVIDKAREAGVPVVFFNREPVQEDMQKWDRIVYVGSDARESARLEAQIVIDAYESSPGRIDSNGDGVIQYVMLEGERRHQDAIIRTEVSVETLRAAGLSVEKLDGGIANWDRDQAAALAEEYFNTYGNGVELILCNNDDMALGAADASDKLGMAFHNIVGIDGTAEGMTAVRGRRILGTVVMDVPAHAEAIFLTAYAFATGADPAESLSAEGYTLDADRSVRVPMHMQKAD